MSKYKAAVKKSAKKKGLTGKAKNRYVYGTINKIKKRKKKKKS